MAHTTYENESIGGLVRGALGDVRELVREEMLLARTELKQELSKATAAGLQFGIAGAALWFAAMFLLVSLALALTAAFDLPSWAGFGIVAVVLAVGGMIFMGRGRRVVREVRPLPHTVQSLKENLR